MGKKVEELSGLELRECVAREVMNLANVRKLSGSDMQIWYTDSHPPHCVPAYESDLDASFEVVEMMARLKPHPWMLTLTNWNYYGDRHYEAKFTSHALGPKHVTCEGKTAPLAICRAALQAVRSQQ